MDTRLTTAMAEIGSIVEHDEGLPYEAIAAALDVLAQLTRKRGAARRARLKGQIAAATRIERDIESLYARLPRGARW